MTAHVKNPAATGAEAGTPSALESFYRRAKHGYPASYPIIQFPNLPLIVALGALVVSALTDGTVNDVAQVVFYVAIAWWAFLELTEPVNLFRRVLGGAVLVYVLVFAMI
jgi:hypothetical protein